MPPPLLSMYEGFVKRSSLFPSVESILSFKSLWPPATILRTYVKNNIGKVSRHSYHIGLDISSKSTGLCVLTDKGDVSDCQAIKPDASCKGNSILSASVISQSIRQVMQAIDSDPQHWSITVEKYLQMFGASSFRTQGLFYLAEINGIVQYKLWEDTGVLPTTVHPSTARSTLSIQSAGNRDATKNAVLTYVQKSAGSSIQWPRKKRSDGLADECFDMADAFVLAQYGLIRDKTDALLEYAGCDQNGQESIAKSSLFADYVRVHIAHHIRKYAQDETVQSFQTLPPEFLEKQFSKMCEGLLAEVARITIAPSDSLPE